MKLMIKNNVALTSDVWLYKNKQHEVLKKKKPGEDDIFRRSTLALGPTQPPVKWVPGLSQG